MGDAEKNTSVVAIIPAAGRSGRMGTPKQLLHVDGKPMLLGIVDALLGGGAARVVVVTNSAVREALQSLPPDVDVVLNDDPKTQMIESIRIGLTSSPTAGGYLVCPSDAARITAADVRRCFEAFAETPGRIVIATHDGRRGHPMIFPQSLAAVVQSAECDAGLNRLSRNRPQLVREVVCDSPGTVSNVNTPADYEKLK
jgi:molybdenum cofactor cytidylyltransferase